MNRFENAKILCIGGALDYLSGNTKTPPVLFSGKLEFIWRLRNETFRRIFRLLLSTVLLIRNYWRSEFYNLNIKK
jgi:UDP-N-acetyl-D-mannosaminuronic acid transferase (WecB/TagA/CpsF family)